MLLSAPHQWQKGLSGLYCPSVPGEKVEFGPEAAKWNLASVWPTFPTARLILFSTSFEIKLNLLSLTSASFNLGVLRKYCSCPTLCHHAGQSGPRKTCSHWEDLKSLICVLLQWDLHMSIYSGICVYYGLMKKCSYWRASNLLLFCKCGSTLEAVGLKLLRPTYGCCFRLIWAKGKQLCNQHKLL